METAVDVRRRSHTGTTLHLFDDVRVASRGRTVPVPEGGKRLLALLAVQGRHVDRRWAYGRLWPDVGDERAAGNLRSCIWRLHGLGVVDVGRTRLGLHSSLAVDIDDVDRWVGSVANGTAAGEELRIHRDCVYALDLLPGWYDDWVVMARERLRQRVLRALEMLSRTLSEQSRHAEAVEAAMLAVQLEPLRDSAQRTLIRAHLVEGNWSEGRRSCKQYVDLLRTELDVEPDPELAKVLVSPWSCCAEARAHLVGNATAGQGGV